jgi:hypothetical protein
VPPENAKAKRGVCFKNSSSFIPYTLFLKIFSLLQNLKNPAKNVSSLTGFFPEFYFYNWFGAAWKIKAFLAFLFFIIACFSTGVNEKPKRGKMRRPRILTSAEAFAIILYKKQRRCNAGKPCIEIHLLRIGICGRHDRIAGERQGEGRGLLLKKR